MKILTELEKKEIIEKKKLELMNNYLLNVLNTALKNLDTMPIEDLDYFIIKQISRVTQDKTIISDFVSEFRTLVLHGIKKL